MNVEALADGGTTPTALGAATLGLRRPDLAALYGSAFEPSGFRLDPTTRLPPGGYTLQVTARSTVTGLLDLLEVPVVVEARTLMSLDQPKEGSTAGPPFKVSGWAFHTGVPGAVGVDAVHVWAFPKDGTAPFPLGAAKLGMSRPDIAAIYGVPELELSGFRLDVSDPIPLGSYVLRVFVRDTITNEFSTVRERTVNVTTEPRMVVDVPKEGSTNAFPFKVSGWAVDLSARLGSGVDAVHVWAYPDGNLGAGIRLGPATLGQSRPGVATLFGDPTKELSGYRLDVAGGLAPGSYTLGIFARSTVTGTFNNFVFRTMVVP